MTSEERLRRMEAWLSNLYKDAEGEMRGKWDAYMARQEKRAEKLRKAVDDAKTPEEKRAAEAKYKAHLKAVTSGSKYYRDMAEELARKYHEANKLAAEYVNGKRADFFADGYNFSAGQINDVAVAQDIAIRFDLCSADAVNWIAERQNDLLLPGPREPKAREDMTWNIRNINSQVAQGIVQGESIPKIAARLRNVSDMNLQSSVRNARTMATGCQNGGRVQAMKTAEGWGVQTRKEWVCTNDGRTRDSHLNPPPKGVNGERVGPDEWFSNNCRFPGDPVGPAAEVYNCRCTLVTVVDGFSSTLPKGKEGAIHVTIDGEEITQNTSYAKSRVVDGTDITKSFKRRKNEFDFEIEDVINAQGFDGLPRVVGQKEFEEAVRAANNGQGFVAQRAYSADTQETLDEYRDMLYNGKWYVDCSTGGARHGQGMYCSADYSGQLTKDIKLESDAYATMYGNRPAYIETFTLDPSAKLEEENKIRELMRLYNEETRKASYTKAIEETQKDVDELIKEYNKYFNVKLTREEMSTYLRGEQLKHIGSNEYNRELKKQTEQIIKKYKLKDHSLVESRFRETEAYNSATQNEFKDIGSFAAALGYDGIKVSGRESEVPYLVVLNRTKVIFLKGD